MKANAKKLLALIMAMVMCLSLASPAFAAYKAGTSGAPGTYDGVSQDNTNFMAGSTAGTYVWNVASAYHIIPGAANDGSYTIYGMVNGNVYTPNSKDEVTEETIAVGNVTDAKPPISDITVKWKSGGTYLIGEQPTDAKYDVSYGGAGPEEVTVAATPGGTKVISDVVDDMKPILTTIPSTTSGVEYEVQGKYYEEKLPNGTVNVYFRLDTYENDAFNSSKPVDLVTKGIAPVGTNETKLKAALEQAETCNAYGESSGTAITDPTVLVKKTVKSSTAVATEYTVEVINKVDLKSASFGAKAPVDSAADTVSNGTAVCEVADDKTTGSFQVRIRNVSGTDSDKWFYVTDAATVETMVKSALEGQPVIVESIVAASSTNDYWTVTVKKNEATSVKALWTKNAVEYKDLTGNSTAVLINASKDGWFNGKDNKGTDAATLSAAAATGPVYVRAKDIPTTVTFAGVTTDKFVGTGATATFTGWDGSSDLATLISNNKAKLVISGSTNDWTFKGILFNSVADMKGIFTTTDCSKATTIPYAELKVNPLIDGKLNTLVEMDGWTWSKNSGTDKFDAAKKASVTTDFDTVNEVSAIASATLDTSDLDADGLTITGTTTYDHDRAAYTVAPKYDDPTLANITAGWFDTAFDTPSASFVNKGSVEVKAAKHGGKLVEVTTETPATCQAKGEKTVKTTCDKCHQVVSEKTTEIPAITDPVEKNVPSDPTQWAFPGNGNTKHYYAKQEDVTTTDPATGEITVTTTYYCNFGVAHETKEKTYKKTDLQHSGKWDAITLDKKTALELWGTKGSVTNTLGLVKTVTVADTDVEFATIPMNRSTDAKFTFSGNLSTGGGTTDAAGNYYDYKALATGVPVYTSATGVGTTKYYAAQMTISDIVTSATKCEDSSCTVTIDVYEVDKKVATANTIATLPTGVTSQVQAECLAAINTDATLEQNLKDKKVTLVKTYSEKVVIPGTGHTFYNSLGEPTELCVDCGAKKPTETESANPIDPANVTVKNMTWTGKVAQPKVTVKDADGFTLIKGTDYVVSEIDSTDVGEYSITIKGLNEYSGNKFTKTFKINKAKATLKKKSAPSTLTANKNKAVTGQIKMTVTGGKVSAYKVTGKVSGVSVNKSGKITVKKGNKKAGTLKVKVSMKADKNHTAAKAVTVKVAIKAAPAAKKTTKK